MKSLLQQLRVFLGIPSWIVAVVVLGLILGGVWLDDYHPAVRLTTFTIVLLGIVGLVHRYLWLRAVRDTKLGRSAARWTAMSLWLLFLAIPSAFVASRSLPRSTVAVLTILAFVWLTLALYISLVFLAGDVLRVLRFMVMRFFSIRESEPDLARRTFINRALATTAVVGAGVTTFAGSRLANGEVTTPEVPITLDRLPGSMSGFRIALLADLHIGPMIGRERVQAIVDRANALRPDMIAIVGDVVDGSVELIGDDVAPLGDLRARSGIFFVTGNHEYYSGVVEWVHYFQRMRITVLDNQHVPIGGVSGFDLAGVHDWRAQWMSPVYKPDMDTAVYGRDIARELIVLAHQPAHIVESARVDAGLQLSGHTHGGQLWPLGYLAHLQQPYVRGLHRHTESRTQIYVSCGTGFWGPPVRVDCPPEITQIILVAG